MVLSLALKFSRVSPILLPDSSFIPDLSNQAEHSMSVSPLSPQPPIDPRTSPKPAAVKDAAPAASPSATSDRVTISAAGHAALAKDQAAPAQPAHASPPAPGITNDQALQLGKALQRSNPAHFKQADINGDGKLSAAEAREAGLKA